MAVRHTEFKGNPSPVDPNVKVPEAVRRQAEEANKRQREAYNLPDPAAAATPEPAPEPQPQNPQPAPAPEPAPTPEPAPQPSTLPSTVPETGAHDSWENRFKAENGRYLAAKRILDSNTHQMELLRQQVTELTAQVANATRAPVAPPVDPATKLVTEKDESEFGPEMLDLMRRVARETIAPELAPVRTLQQTTETLAARINGTAQVVTRNAREAMMQTLDEKMPEWRQVNNMEEFKAWLALPDPYFGVIRHPKLLEAFDQNDTARVLQFFKGFVSELAATSPATPGLPTPPAPQPDRQSLLDLAAPGRARQSAAPTPPTEKQTITTADINAFYAAKRAGKYNGREEEFNRLEEELFQAQREGRVRAV